MKTKILTALFLSFAHFANCAPFDTWVWRNPLPHGNGLTALTAAPVAGQNTVVAVGQAGTIMTSIAANSWILQNSGTSNSLNGAAFGGGLFIAVGDQGTIVTSPDAAAWTIRPSGTTVSLADVAFGNGRFVAVGSGTNLISADGVTWLPGSLGTNRFANLSKVAFGNGMFVAVGSLSVFGVPQSIILTTLDGTTWTRAALPSLAVSGDALSGVVFDNGQFVAVGNVFRGARVLTSPDGVTWTERTVNTTGLTSVTAGGGKFLALADQFGSSAPGVSTDGATWSNFWPPYTLGLLPRVGFGVGRFFLLGEGGIVLESATATNFTGTVAAYRGEFWDALWNNGLFVAVGEGDPSGAVDAGILTSPDGLTWNPASGFTRLPLRSVAFGNGKYVAVGLANVGLTSDDGINWNQAPSTGAELWGLTFGQGLFVGVGEQGAVVTSPDGLVWTVRNSGVASTIYDVAFANGLFVAVGERDFLIAGSSPVTLVSPDAITWTPVTWNAATNPAPTAVLRGISFLKDQFVAVGFNGQVRHSRDGRNWTAHTAKANAALKKVIHVKDAPGSPEGTYIVVGHTGVIMTSTNLSEWQQVQSGTLNDLNALATDGLSAIAAGDWGTILQAGFTGLPGPPNPPFIISITIIAASDAAIQFSTQAGRTYHLQASPDLSTWQSVASLTGNGSVQTLTETLAPNFSARFYRLLVD